MPGEEKDPQIIAAEAEQTKLNKRASELDQRELKMYIDNLRLNKYPSHLLEKLTDLKTAKYLAENPEVWKRNEDATATMEETEEEEETESVKNKKKKNESVQQIKANAGIPSVNMPDGTIAVAEDEFKRFNADIPEAFFTEPFESPKEVHVFRNDVRINALPPGYGPDGVYRPHWKVIA